MTPNSKPLPSAPFVPCATAPRNHAIKIIDGRLWSSNCTAIQSATPEIDTIGATYAMQCRTYLAMSSMTPPREK
jgi:hypothetical protein